MCVRVANAVVNVGQVESFLTVAMGRGVDPFFHANHIHTQRERELLLRAKPTGTCFCITELAQEKGCTHSPCSAAPLLTMLSPRPRTHTAFREST